MLASLFSLVLSVYFVTFTDKTGSQPIAFSERALEQRAKWQIPTDSLDYAVRTDYLDSLRSAGAEVQHSSRWFNGATCKMSRDAAEKVRQFSFVQTVEETRSETQSLLYAPKKNDTATDSTYGVAEEQLALYNLLSLHAAGYEGQGILMTICDGGFHNAQNLTCFDAAHRLGVFDFTDDTDNIYGTTGDHGTMCLSTIAARTDDYHGSATRADYYLMRSEEYATESRKELDNLVVALEKADSLGVNVFSVSLGYGTEAGLTYAEMDGRSTRASLAATLAAQKGMLVCVAAGNEGAKPWYYITSPADAEDILCVGAVDTDGDIAYFSSRGPASDGRTKPDVCAVGAGTYLIQPTTGTAQRGNGTSFACPLIAGLAASLWSALPDENATQIRERIIRSANRYTTPDNTYGYGIPDAWAAYQGTTGLPQTELPHTPDKILLGGKICIRQGAHLYNLIGNRLR